MASLLGFSLSVLASDLCPPASRAPAGPKINDILDVLQTKSKVFFSGAINKSSINRLLKRLDKVIEKNQGSKQVITLSLSSTGGDINETIRAVRYIRSLNLDPLITINTKVSSHSDCESACTILFTAGEKRLADERSRFGFHSPKLEKGKVSGMTKKEIEEHYRGIWLNYVGMVDKTAADTIKSRGYLLDPEMSYISGRNLNTGYVTDFL